MIVVEPPLLGYMVSKELVEFIAITGDIGEALKTVCWILYVEICGSQSGVKF